ncbi:epimerase [Brevibacillus nitrificans]|uniref:epimerase n=1 Tax=Brevibacillus nitrificans TaxID=651560 RepID=UPI0026356198|nr:epimerase [Brevibacillus nitrificans]MED1793617.1 epimerase [Brevibacillus nitrificans]
MKSGALDLFGELLMRKVRDESIEMSDRIIEGKMTDRRLSYVNNLLLENEDNELIRALVPRIVDITLHHLLWTIEQEESIDVLSLDETGHMTSIREISDGLPGELYTDRGWIARYSQQRNQEE